MNSALKDKLILIIANEPWGDIWYSKHNYAYELSKHNTVIFINPAPSWKILNGFKKPKLTKIEGNLFTLNYFNYFPIFNEAVSKLNNYLCSSKIKNYITNYFSRSIDVFWSFDPHRFFEPKLFSPALSVFHVVDKYNFRFFGEKLLAKNCDLIIVVSKTFENAYLDLNKNIIHVPHGISDSQFINKKAPELKYDGLYIGNIDERINFRLLEKILIAFPKIDLLFIGKFYGDKDKIAKNIFIEKKYPNLIWVGSKPFNELKDYIAGAKFCLSIMDTAHPGNDIAHHKTLQYLAFGKPIFGSIFKDYSDISDLIYQSNTDTELIELMRTFISKNESEELIAKRIQYAKQFTYDKHISLIQKALSTIKK